MEQDNCDNFARARRTRELARLNRALIGAWSLLSTRRHDIGKDCLRQTLPLPPNEHKLVPWDGMFRKRFSLALESVHDVALTLSLATNLTVERALRPTGWCFGVRVGLVEVHTGRWRFFFISVRTRKWPQRGTVTVHRVTTVGTH